MMSMTAYCVVQVIVVTRAGQVKLLTY